MSSETWEKGFQDGVRGFGIHPLELDADTDLASGYAAGQAAVAARPVLAARINSIAIARGLSGEPFDPDSLSEDEQMEVEEEAAEIETIIAAIPRQ